MNYQYQLHAPIADVLLYFIFNMKQQVVSANVATIVEDLSQHLTIVTMLAEYASDT